MGWRFSKSFRIGGFRWNVSKRGLGMSWGVPGFRVGRSADGKRYLTIGIPGTGIYYRHDLDRSRRGGPPAAPEGWIPDHSEAQAARIPPPQPSGTGAPCAPLPPGTKLFGGRFSVGRVLARDGVTITYQGSEPQLRRLVVIQEFAPDGCVRQQTDVIPTALWPPEDYARALRQFVHEARVPAEIGGARAGRVLAIFEVHNTVYRVLEHLGPV